MFGSVCQRFDIKLKVRSRYFANALYAFLTICMLSYSSASPGSPMIDARFSMFSSSGAQVTESSYLGKWQLIYFGYASCPDVCSIVMKQVADALTELGPISAQIQPFFITLDPANDTSERLSKYLHQFDRRIVGLRGSQIQTLEASRAFRMYFKTQVVAGSSDTIDHSSFLFLLKPDGSFASLLSGTVAGHVLADELRKRLQ